MTKTRRFVHDCIPDQLTLLIALRDALGGRLCWPLSRFENGPQQAFGPMLDAGYVKEKRTGGYPGFEITQHGRDYLVEVGVR